MIVLLFLAFWYFPIFYKAIYNFEYQNLERLAFFLMVSLLLTLHQVLITTEQRLPWVCHIHDEIGRLLGQPCP